MKIIAVIPARGGSKGIPRKNVRLMNGMPLIEYSINNAKACKLITDIVVSSDDEEIVKISRNSECEIVLRDKTLAEDSVTLDPVIHDAVLKMENRKGYKYDIVITLQPTSPLLTSQTLNLAIESFIESSFDTYISVINQPHLSWTKINEKYKPCYKQRVNRQYLPENYVETGAFVISRRDYVTKTSRLGKDVSVYEVPENESIDIDTIDDWQLCENHLKRKKIVFRADGHKNLGMGHIFRVLTLVYSMTGHNIVIVTNEKYYEGVEVIKKSNLIYKTIKNDEEFIDFLQVFNPDIVVNDCLDTDSSYIRKLKSVVNRVVTFEDLGNGRIYADAVINALYVEEKSASNIFSGEQYICLREEFIIQKHSKFNKNVKNILVMFGGTDPTNLTKKIYGIAKEIDNKYKFTFITGPAYNCEVNGIVSDMSMNIEVIENIKRVTDYMKNSDIAITSQGRTVFELATMGVPSIVLAQNEREQLHKFAQMANGFLNLGLGKNVEKDTIKNTLMWLIDTPDIRKEMQSLMLKHDLKSGIERVKNIILGG